MNLCIGIFHKNARGNLEFRDSNSFCYGKHQVVNGTTCYVCKERISRGCQASVNLEDGMISGLPADHNHEPGNVHKLEAEIEEF